MNVGERMEIKKILQVEIYVSCWRINLKWVYNINLSYLAGGLNKNYRNIR